MKGIDLFCSSPASTRICSSLARPNYFHRNSRKSTSSSSSKQSDFHRKSSADKYSSDAYKQNDNNLRRKSSAGISDVAHSSSTSYLLGENVPYIDWIWESDGLILHPDNHRRRRTKAEQTRLNGIAPARRSCSLAYYGTDHNDMVSENDGPTALVSSHSTNSRFSSSDISPALKSSSSARPRDQVVDLWVSIHCKGCEGKIRKHISKMEGVRSFSIDLATKKVRVIGNVSPLGVLASVSKVKNAQLWPSTATPPSPSTS